MKTYTFLVEISKQARSSKLVDENALEYKWLFVIHLYTYLSLDKHENNRSYTQFKNFNLQRYSGKENKYLKLRYKFHRPKLAKNSVQTPALCQLVLCFPQHFFRVLPLPTYFKTERTTVEASLIVK